MGTCLLVLGCTLHQSHPCTLQIWDRPAKGQVCCSLFLDGKLPHCEWWKNLAPCFPSFSVRASLKQPHPQGSVFKPQYPSTRRHSSSPLAKLGSNGRKRVAVAAQPGLRHPRPIVYSLSLFLSLSFSLADEVQLYHHTWTVPTGGQHRPPEPHSHRLPLHSLHPSIPAFSPPSRWSTCPPRGPLPLT